MNEIFARRSTRRFLDRPVEPEKLERILRAAMQAPSAHNRQDWEFLVVTDREKILAVSQMSDVTVSAKNAPALIIPLANHDRGQTEPLMWTCDLGAATENILLQIEAEGLGGCWLSCWPYQYKVDYLKKLFALPAHITPYAVVTVGYKEKEKPFEDRWDPEKVHREVFCWKNWITFI